MFAKVASTKIDRIKLNIILFIMIKYGFFSLNYNY